LRTLRILLMTGLVAAATYVVSAKRSSALLARQGTKSAADESTLLKAFAEIQPIDAHMHVYKDSLALNTLMQRLKLRMLNICVIDDRDPFFKGLEPQRSDVLGFLHSTGGRAAFCTTFSPYNFEDPGFSERVIRQLDADFAAGAVAVKIYKVMGMEMKSKAGQYVMADDPAFEPIYQHIAAHHRTVVAHLA
jgi:hypothetical protein